METLELTRKQLRQRLAAHRITVRRFAKEAGIYPTDMYDILAGGRVGPMRRKKIEEAAIRLRLDREPPPEDEQPLVRIRPL